VVLIVACIPPIRPLFLLILDKVSSSMHTITGGRTGQDSKIELRSLNFSEPQYVGEATANDRDPPYPYNYTVTETTLYYDACGGKKGCSKV
jgi:hypothetical protein